MRPGDKVELVSTTATESGLEPGMKGEILSVNSAGTMLVEWDEIGRFALIPGEDVWREI